MVRETNVSERGDPPASTTLGEPAMPASLEPVVEERPDTGPTPGPGVAAGGAPRVEAVVAVVADAERHARALERTLDPGDPRAAAVTELRRAAEHAAALARELAIGAPPCGEVATGTIDEPVPASEVGGGKRISAPS